MKAGFGGMPWSRIALETGIHSPWVSWPSGLCSAFVPAPLPPLRPERNTSSCDRPDPTRWSASDPENFFVCFAAAVLIFFTRTCSRWDSPGNSQRATCPRTSTSAGGTSEAVRARRAPVREALRQLEALFSYPHRGTVVAEDQSDHDPNPAHSAELNWVFHEILYAPAGLPRMLNIIKTLHYQALRYHLVGFVALDFKRESQGGHRRILEA